MLCPYVSCVIDKDTFTKIHKEVLAHEIPILSLIHGGRVFDIEDVQSERDMNPDTEWSRLLEKYGIEPERKTPFVEIAYGAEITSGLKDAMQKGLGLFGLEAEEEPAEVVPVKKKRGRPKKAA